MNSSVLIHYALSLHVFVLLCRRRCTHRQELRRPFGGSPERRRVAASRPSPHREERPVHHISNPFPRSILLWSRTTNETQCADRALFFVDEMMRRDGVCVCAGLK